MTVRTPLYINSDGDLQEMTTSMINVLKDAAVFHHATSVGTSLAVVGSGGNLGTINDNRLIAGNAITRADRFATQAETGDASNISIAYNRFSETSGLGSVQTDSGVSNFCYYDGNDVVAMTNTDMFDTIFSPAIDMLVDGTDRDGTYRIATSTSISNMTLVSSTAVFTDTRANVGAYTAGGIGETPDQPTTVTNYYLHQVNQGYGGTPSVTLPAQVTSGGDIQAMSSSNFGTFMNLNMKYYSGIHIRYSINGSGNNRGSGMVDTRMNGSNYQTRFVNTDDYRAQEFPGGSAITVSTNHLRIRRI
tara:strand:+ start:442 stop:1353 length:912 start_codon:yes stop_codon:yes gene_type:complete